MKNKKIINTKLEDIVKKYSDTNVLFLLEREYKSLPITKIKTTDIDDNRYLKQIKIQKDQLNFLLNAYANNIPLEPLIVRPKKDHYEVVVGRKRLHVARKVNVEEVNAIVIDYTDEEMLLILLMVARAEHYVNPIEMAIICSSLSRKYNYSQETLARLTHQSRSQISSFTRILTLPDHVLNLVSSGKLKYGHARALITLPENLAIELADRAVKENLTVRDLERENRKYRGINNNNKISKLETKYNASIKEGDNELNIKFKNKADFAAFLEKMHD
ncbi:MAG: ParB/RepB/Spo0J family partition protein [Bacilli bacterium]|jgi:ParB family chromosome partitioning protein